MNEHLYFIFYYMFDNCNDYEIVSLYFVAIQAFTRTQAIVSTYSKQFKVNSDTKCEIFSTFLKVAIYPVARATSRTYLSEYIWSDFLKITIQIFFLVAIELSLARINSLWPIYRQSVQIHLIYCYTHIWMWKMI